MRTYNRTNTLLTPIAREHYIDGDMKISRFTGYSIHVLHKDTKYNGSYGEERADGSAVVLSNRILESVRFQRVF